MRSQKSITLVPGRVEVHDLSDTREAAQSDLPLTMSEVLSALEVSEANAVGTNYQLVLELPEDTTAARAVTDRLLRSPNGITPPGTGLQGGSVNLFLKQPNGLRITVQMEPRLNDPDTRSLWAACNCHASVAEVPTVDDLSRLFSRGYEVLTHVLQSAFGTRRGRAR